MKIPYIPTIESASALIDIVSNSKELSSRMKTLLELQDNINALIKRHEEFRTVEAFRDTAEQRMREAEQARKDVDEYVRKQRDEAQAIVFDVQAFKQREQDVAKQRTASLDKRSEFLDAQEIKLAKLGEQLMQQEQQLKLREVEAQRLLKHGQQLEAEFSEKLAKLKALA